MSPILFVVIMLVLSGFFSGLEIAFLSANKLRIELNSNQGKHWAKLCSNYIKSPSKFISTILVGNNIALVMYGIAMEELLRPRFVEVFSQVAGADFLALLIATLISTFIVLITAEFLPKTLFRLNPSGILAVLIYPFQFFYYLLWPVVQFVIWLSKTLLNRFLKEEFTEESPAFTKVDLDHFISQSAHATEDGEEQEVDTDILKNALDFGSVQIRDCLVPRTGIFAIDKTSSIAALEQAFIDSKHSRILIYDQNIDNIIGYVHHLDLHKKPKDIKSILIAILITNESKSASDLLNEFSQTQKSIALVVDEYGGTAGIVTLEDIMEEIFGEIEDEHDRANQAIESEQADGSIILSSKSEVDHINEKYNLSIPEGDYETIGGFVITMLEEIPKAGDTFVIDNYEVEILEATDRHIEIIKIKELE